MNSVSRMSLVLGGACLAAVSAAAAPPSACTVKAAGAKAEAARLAELPPLNENTIAWCKDAVPVLIGMLDDASFRARSEGAAALKNATTDDALRAAAVPHLAAIAATTKRLADSKMMSDWGAAVMLQDVMTGMGKAAVPHLIEGLRHEKVRFNSASNLSALGPQAAAALPALRAALKDEKDESTADALRGAIKSIEGK